MIPLSRSLRMLSNLFFVFNNLIFTIKIASFLKLVLDFLDCKMCFYAACRKFGVELPVVNIVSKITLKVIYKLAYSFDSK